jgi:hypothetical protein
MRIAMLRFSVLKKSDDIDGFLVPADTTICKHMWREFSFSGVHADGVFVCCHVDRPVTLNIFYNGAARFESRPAVTEMTVVA